MSVIENTVTTPDEATAVVESTAELLAGAEAGRAYAGHADRRALEEVIAAKAEVGRYCEVDDAGRLGRPHFVKGGEMETVLRYIERWHGWQPGDGVEYLIDEYLVGCQLQAKRRQLAVIGAVSLDLCPDGPRPQDMGHPTEPKILFIAVDRHSPGTEAIWAAGQREYMAVWFQPNTDDDGTPVDRDGRPLQPSGKARRLYCDDRHLPGYWGIVDWFGSRADAKRACRELRDAVFTIGKPLPSADEPDPMRDELNEAAADEDRQRARWERQQQRRQERVSSPFE